MCFAVLFTSSRAASTFYVMPRLTAKVTSVHYIFLASSLSPLASYGEVRECTRSACAAKTERQTWLRVKRNGRQMKLRKSCRCSVRQKPKKKPSRVSRQRLWHRTSRSLGGNCDRLFTLLSLCFIIDATLRCLTALQPNWNGWQLNHSAVAPNTRIATISLSAQKSDNAAAVLSSPVSQLPNITHV